MTDDLDLWTPSMDPMQSAMMSHRAARRTCADSADRCRWSRRSAIATHQGRTVVECAVHTHRMTPYHPMQPRRTYADSVCSSWTPDRAPMWRQEPDFEAIEAARIAALPEGWR